MKQAYFILILVAILSGNAVQSQVIEDRTQVEFNKELANELSRMARVDQIVVNGHPTEEYKNLSQDEWISFKDSVYKAHRTRLDEIFNKYGYPGYDLVGVKGSFDFWLITQHCDFDPSFQMKILDAMRLEIEKENADPRNYAFLTDRVLINTGKKQLYGTQTLFNFNTAQAYPKALEDSINVNERRAQMELEPIEEYLNGMSQRTYDMNKEMFLEKGILGPKLYEVNKAGH